MTIIILLLFVSCKKAKFPDKDNLIGTWTEETDQAFKHKLIFDAESMIFHKSKSIDTLSYRLNKKTGQLFLTLKNNPSIGESNHEISLNKIRKQLTITALFVRFGETSETKFNKE